jgi:osmotically-inducible protein OsmY
MAVGMCSSEDLKKETADRLDRDRRIADNIVAALEMSIPDDAGSIEVDVNQGEVTLSGTVLSLLVFRIAQKLAESAPGVATVYNDLEIR